MAHVPTGSRSARHPGSAAGSPSGHRGAARAAAARPDQRHVAGLTGVLAVMAALSILIL